MKQQVGEEKNEDGTEIENWSSTHSVKTKAYLQPESVEEVRTWPCHDFAESAAPLLVALFALVVVSQVEGLLQSIAQYLASVFCSLATVLTVFLDVQSYCTYLSARLVVYAYIILWEYAPCHPSSLNQVQGPCTRSSHNVSLHRLVLNHG